MSLPDLLRLLAVPVFAWAAWRDYETRRLPSRVWYPLLGLGIVALAWEALLLRGDPFAFRRFAIRVGIGVGLLVPLAYGFWWFGGLGKADAKAFAVIAVLFPGFPSYELAGTTLPLVEPPAGIFAFTILVDAVLVGALYPVALALGNLLAGRFSPAMLVGLPVGWDDLRTAHGKLLETPDGFTLSGLDLDALRMYLRWRGLALEDLRERPDFFRRPSTLPEEPNPPTDGAVDPDADPEPGGAPAASFGGDEDDEWGAAAFLDSIEGSAYGTDPGTLRRGLDLLAERETVWVSPGIPFLVPVFVGLLVALTVGDLLFLVLGMVGVA